MERIERLVEQPVQVEHVGAAAREQRLAPPGSACSARAISRRSRSTKTVAPCVGNCGSCGQLGQETGHAVADGHHEVSTPHQSTLVRMAPLARQGSLRPERCVPSTHRFQIERSLAFDEEHAIRRLVTRCRVPVVPAGLHHVRPRPEPHARLVLPAPGCRCPTGIRPSWRTCACGAERRTRPEASGAHRTPPWRGRPTVGDLDSRSAGRIEVGPFDLAGWQEDGRSCCASTGAARLSEIENATLCPASSNLLCRM